MKKIILSGTIVVAFVIGFGLSNSLSDQIGNKKLLKLNIESVAFADEGTLPCSHGTEGSQVNQEGSFLLHCDASPCAYRWLKKVTSNSNCLTVIPE